jgi:hypothetical protein
MVSMVLVSIMNATKTNAIDCVRRRPPTMIRVPTNSILADPHRSQLCFTSCLELLICHCQRQDQCDETNKRVGTSTSVRRMSNLETHGTRGKFVTSASVFSIYETHKLGGSSGIRHATQSKDTLDNYEESLRITMIIRRSISVRCNIPSWTKD